MYSARICDGCPSEALSLYNQESHSPTCRPGHTIEVYWNCTNICKFKLYRQTQLATTYRASPGRTDQPSGYGENVVNTFASQYFQLQQGFAPLEPGPVDGHAFCLRRATRFVSAPTVCGEVLLSGCGVLEHARCGVKAFQTVGSIPMSGR